MGLLLMGVQGKWSHAGEGVTGPVYCIRGPECLQSLPLTSNNPQALQDITLITSHCPSPLILGASSEGREGRLHPDRWALFSQHSHVIGRPKSE